MQVLLVIKSVLLNMFVNIQVKFVQPNGKKELNTTPSLDLVGKI